ncbi:UNVERIFIED_CONTAM: hypothetical protein GTU68_005038 [Idotea baltica]|nr:hypothetical protein [Idotea baltica]
MSTTEFNGSHAQIIWDTLGQPSSLVFDDIYFSNENGIAETEHNFLTNNQLADRFHALLPNEHFTLAETGFGTGLNLLCAWRLFQQQAHPEAHLHFISTERYPLKADDLIKALSLWPEFEDYSQHLIKHYQAIHPGFQRIHLNKNITLTLLIGDATEMLSQLTAQVDAWFFDGFSPAKNPAMWSEDLFKAAASLSHVETTFGTFTCAGAVKRNLISAGFSAIRVAGTGKKRHVLTGKFIAKPHTKTKERHAIVVGAGISGCATAASLARTGWSVTLIERHSSIAQEASGNPQGVLYLKISAHSTALSRFILSGFGYTRRLLPLLKKTTQWDDCGVLQLSYSAKETIRHQALSDTFLPDLLYRMSQSEASIQAGIPLTSGGIFYPQAGWVHPPSLCRLLQDHSSIKLITCQDAAQIKKQNDLWTILDAKQQTLACAESLILTTASDTLSFSQTAHLPLKNIRGQITQLPATPKSQKLASVVCGKGYITPARSKQHTLGASFNFHRTDSNLSDEEHLENIEHLKTLSPDIANELSDSLNNQQMVGRVSFRSTTPDYLPLIGPISDVNMFEETYQMLSKNAHAKINTECPWLKGLYVNAGHGSRGLITAPIAGEMIASWLNNTVFPVERDLINACHPNRFLWRRLARKP